MTTNQRHKIYKKALRLLLSGNRDSICIILDCIINNAIGFSDCPAINKTFPEYYLFTEYNKCYKWDLYNDKESRITVLLFCIEMTKA